MWGEDDWSNNPFSLHYDDEIMSEAFELMKEKYKNYEPNGLNEPKKSTKINSNKQKPTFGTLSVVFWNDVRGSYGTKWYNYACNIDALKYVDRYDVLNIKTQFGEGKVRVVNKSASLLKEADREIDYRMVVGDKKDKFNKFVKYNDSNDSTENNTKKEGKTMKATMKDMMKRFMCEVENVGMSMTDGKMGIKKEGSVFTISAEQNVQENMFDFASFDVPAMGISTPVANVKIGDIVVENGKAIGWVTKEINDTGKIEVTRISGTKYSMVPPENLTMGTKNIMVVKSMFEGMLGNIGTDTAGQPNMMQNMMMMQMMGDGEMDTNKMMMLMMMQGQGQGNNPMASMLPMMMMMNKN